MKVFNLHILTQNTLDERLSLACKSAAREAIVIPNKMISKLLWQIHGKHRESLREAYRKAKMRA